MLNTNAVVASKENTGAYVSGASGASVQVTANAQNWGTGLNKDAAVHVTSVSKAPRAQLTVGESRFVLSTTIAATKPSLVLQHNEDQMFGLSDDHFNVSKSLTVLKDMKVMKSVSVEAGATLHKNMQRLCEEGMGQPSLFGKATRFTNNNHCYFVSVVRLNFTAAADVCEAQGGYLATITNDDENNKARALFRPDQSGFIGLSDVGATAFRWTNGEMAVSSAGKLYDRIPVSHNLGYFGRHHVDNTHQQHCAALGNEGSWQLADCNTASLFMCERNG